MNSMFLKKGIKFFREIKVLLQGHSEDCKRVRGI